MARLKKSPILFNILKIWAGAVAFLLVLFSVSVIKVIPLFEIRHISVHADGSRRELSLITKEIISRDLDNNYLLLLLNKDYLLNQLMKATQYYVKDLKILNFDWHNGYLVIQLYTNKAVASLNGKYNLALNGLIFGFYKPKKVVEIYDFQRNWQFGDIYPNVNVKTVRVLQKRLGLKEIFVKGDVIYLKGSEIELVVKKDLINGDTQLIKSSIQKIASIYNGRKRVNLFGKKAIYIKIFKERTDE